MCHTNKIKQQGTTEDSGKASSDESPNLDEIEQQFTEPALGRSGKSQAFDFIFGQDNGAVEPETEDGDWSTK